MLSIGSIKKTMKLSVKIYPRKNVCRRDTEGKRERKSVSNEKMGECNRKREQTR